ncbi:MAG: SUMF1/EgtB/PvdO family nonheme iron enzyme [Kineosporiaceae bacterium]
MRGSDLARYAATILRLGGPGHSRVPLATTRRVEIGRWQTMRNTAFFLDDDIAPAELRCEHDPDHCLPPHAVTDIYELSSRPSPRLHHGVGHALLRSEPALAAVGAHPRLVLLGEPGSGKTTLLRDLAVGAGRSVTRLAEVDGTSSAGDLLDRVLGRHPAGARPDLLLLDGLDEIPPRSGTGPGRRELAQAAGALAARHPDLHIVLTCRAAAFADLTEAVDWPVAVLAPLTLGQVRHLVAGLVGDLVADEQAVAAGPAVAAAPAVAARLAAELVDACAEQPWLLELMRTPLAVALVSVLTLESGRVPDDPAAVCALVRGLMLEQWDAARGLPDLATFAGVPGWSTTDADQLLDRLGRLAHAAAPEPGRGLLPQPDDDERPRREALAERTGILVRTGVPPGEWSAPELRQRGACHHSLLVGPDVPFQEIRLPPLGAAAQGPPPSGLPTRLGFAALTLQEDACTRYLATRSDPVAAVLVHRTAERWTEPIVGLGRRLDPAALRRLLDRLLDPPGVPREPGSGSGSGEAPERRQRDVLLAARLLTAAAPATRALPDLAAVEPVVRRGLVAVLADVAQPLLEDERIEVADLLADVGDDRYPVSGAGWRDEVERAVAGARDGYFCRVDAGPYWIGAGSPADLAQARGDEGPIHRIDLPATLYVARYPVTWEQWRAWPGADPGAAEPRRRGNEPVTTGLRSAAAFCRWLGELVGATVRLPTEVEWEAASRGGDRRQFPWGDPPVDDRAWTFRSRARRGLLHARATVPVGCYPAGAAPCGAVDMAGNVGEWTTSTWRAYPGAGRAFDDPRRHVLRGGGYTETDSDNRCAARRAPGDHDRTVGLRVVLVP